MDNRFLKDEKGFTGLEAAIVLIAFVVVAAVFSYVMLGAGFFTTQKSQEVVHTGVTQASSSLAPAGDVIVRGDTVAGKADQITFYVTNTAGGTPVDLDKTVLTYTDNKNFKSKEYLLDSGAVAGSQQGPAATLPVADWAVTNGWAYQTIITVNDDNLLESGEKIKVMVDLAKLTDDADGSLLPGINEKFKIELKPPEGAVLSITKTLPPALATDTYYPVY